MNYIVTSWKTNGITLLCFVYCLSHHCRFSAAIAIDGVPIESESVGDDSFEQPRIWSTLLEELTINSSMQIRDGRAMQMPYKYIPTSNIYINRRVENPMPLGPQALKQNFQFNGASTGGPASGSHNFFNNRVPQNGPPPQEVSETDLYLLSAIEKLVFRVDYMERRLRKTEQIVYYLMAGNNEHRKEIYDKPCSMNFTRVGDNCYRFVANQQANWKTANSVCRSYGAHLAELEGLNENNDIAAYLLNHPHMLNGHGNYWLGGLNPGLLWIWSSSARPVNPNVNLTQIHNSTQPAASSITPKVSTKINKDNKSSLVNKKGHTNATNATTTTPAQKKPLENTKIVSTNDDTFRIEGNGRCLGLSYKSNKHAYHLHGLDCTDPQKFICELPQDFIDNEIDRIAKKLFS